MEQYIKKSALVAKIKERIKTYNKGYANGDDSRADALEVLLHDIDIDTIEVKEVDLEEKVESWMKEVPSVKLEWGNVADAMRDCARHFFELGLKAQHSSIGISNIDDIFEENGIDPDSKDAKILKECYYMALEKLKVQKGEQ